MAGCLASDVSKTIGALSESKPSPANGDSLLVRVTKRGPDRERLRLVYRGWTTATLRRKLKLKYFARNARNLMYAELVRRQLRPR